MVLKEIYTVDEIAEILSITPMTVRRYINEGKIKAIKIARSWRIRRDELERIMEEGV
ncbi:helix-turn-helix domain-containing protein [Methanovulcanius yangii]|uniref:helix-turn-helix domain-containing protein n=1 Tax=Methanovulcanius yangii TaxID=1789227 RepID=UPI0029C9E17E|nr:helix-turn-helix domain-containing protein [Methanovulcanius yangii]